MVQPADLGWDFVGFFAVNHGGAAAMTPSQRVKSWQLENIALPAAAILLNHRPAIFPIHLFHVRS